MPTMKVNPGCEFPEPKLPPSATGLLGDIKAALAAKKLALKAKSLVPFGYAAEKEADTVVTLKAVTAEAKAITDAAQDYQTLGQSLFDFPCPLPKVPDPAADKPGTGIPRKK